MKPTYLDVLASFGIGGAHPGGFDLTKKIINSFQLEKHHSVLDIGCGTGQTASYIHERYGSDVIGIDNHEIMCDKALHRIQQLGYPVEIIQGKAEQLPIEDEMVDFVIAESVLTFTEVPKSLRECKRVLAPNGTLYMVEMTMNLPLTEGEKKSMEHIYGIDAVLSEWEWKDQLLQAGFQHVVIQDPSIAGLTPSAINDMLPSHDISKEMYDVMDEHVAFTQSTSSLGYRVFICT
ncbi:class I SAM-dependent methyltransferase [Pontibacillus salicampi]|uniref:Class I SAM-dependent methyltransferase n=1 Tax=Pontibacillus salicampi TaxID=1449801 RepID=A0ABV6LRG6_9BACI